MILRWMTSKPPKQYIDMELVFNKLYLCNPPNGEGVMGVFKGMLGDKAKLYYETSSDGEIYPNQTLVPVEWLTPYDSNV